MIWSPYDPWASKRAVILWWIKLLILLSAVGLAVSFLTGCATTTFTGYTPPVLINGFDPTLSSHAEALGLKEPVCP